MRHRVRLVLALLPLLLVCGCAKRKPLPAAPALHAGMSETGIASWYGHPYHGRAAASGEIYDMEKLTAAHRTLPFGTVVRVRNLSNDLSVDVRINDRGPFVGDRIIDLSRAAARQIQMIGPGTARVRLLLLKLPSEAEAEVEASYFAVQTGAFHERANAERQRIEMERRFGSARLARRDGDPPVWRVLAGRETTEEGAAALALRIQTEGGQAFVVRVDGSGGY